MDIETALKMAYRAGLNNNNNSSRTNEDVVVTELMEKVTLRRFTIDNWTFDVKLVRALKVNVYGEPYTMAANITLNGDRAYIDTLVGRSDVPMTRNDIRALAKASRKLDTGHLDYDRINSSGKRSEQLAL